MEVIMHIHIHGTFLVILFFLAACGGGDSDSDSPSSQPPKPPAAETAIVLAANDLGMHCMDQEFSVFSILPPFNVVNAQVVRQDNSGRPYLADKGEVELFYQAVTDASESINSYSIGKTDFWMHANALFGIALTEGEGLTGLFMPADDPQHRELQAMEYHLQNEWFTAEGIPITPTDDNMASNPYPLLRITAVDTQSGQQLGNLDVVVPVAVETDCRNCHRTGGIATADTDIVWSTDPDVEIQSKTNILKLHDAENHTQLEASQPVLCARCHYSPALDLAGAGPAGEQLENPTFSSVMHEFHGDLEEAGLPIFPADAPVTETCYQCHPGSVTQCQRGAMKTGGMDCNDCHGDMLAVGGKFPLLADGSMDGANDGNSRRPWLDLPRCQSCHTGDAVNYLTGADLVVDPDWPFRLRQAYVDGDDSASPLLALNRRFAEENHELFRFSQGHGELACEFCHGSTHAVWPNASDSANDNEAAKKLQGYAGTIIECSVCHESGSLPITNHGPHGLHTVNDSHWYDDGHEDAYEDDKDSCKACHGLDLMGTPLSRIPTARSFQVEAEDGEDRDDDQHHTVTYVKGDLVRCNRCHEMPEL